MDSSECIRIADQLRRALEGKPWHGAPLRELLAGVTAEQACLRPLPSAHTVWELVLHIEVYLHIAFEATGGTPMPRLFETGEDWFVPTDETDTGWAVDTRRLSEVGERLARAIETFDDSRLPDIVPGRGYDFYYLFHGVIQHSLYHGGQIAMLKTALSG